MLAVLRRYAPVLAGIAFVALLWFLHPLPTSAATITVTGTGDTVATDDLTTLREAITAVNNQADVNVDVTLNRVGNYASLPGGTPDVIAFNIPAAGVQTIAVVSPLPALTRTMAIDGTTQPGSFAAPLIELDGTTGGIFTNGLEVMANGCTIRGLIINRFADSGIRVIGQNTTISRNLIGTNATATAALGNGNAGVFVVSANNTIGATTTSGAGNIISGNLQGIVLSGSGATGNLVQQNAIGTDATLNVAIPNTFAGVNIVGGASGNTIGGTLGIARNLISGNFQGVVIQQSGTSANVVQGNSIGVNIAGTAVANTTGISIVNGATGNTIGGTAVGAGNIVADNTTAGVIIGASAADTATVGNSVRGNSIHDNGGSGIDLAGDGVTPNGANPRALPNNGQNYPVLTAATRVGSNITLTGTLSSAPNALFHLDFYANPTADGSGHGEGGAYLGALDVTTDGGGSASFAGSFAAPTGQNIISATATNAASGDTSEFSADVAALVSVTVACPAGVKVGETAPCTATGVYGDASTVDVTAAATWTIGVTAVATVDASGRVTGVSPGAATVTAMVRGVQGQASVTVLAPMPIGISVPPAPASRPSGASGPTSPSPSTVRPQPIPTGR